MSVASVLKEEKNRAETAQAVFRFRATAERVAKALYDADAIMGTISRGYPFRRTNTEVLDKGAEIQKIISEARKALEKHSDFLVWNED